MIIKVTPNSPICTILINCMGEMTHKQLDNWFVKRDENGNMLLDVQLSINGCEADFSHFTNLLIEKYDELLEKHAKSLLKEHMSSILQKLYDIEEAVDQIHLNEYHELVP